MLHINTFEPKLFTFVILFTHSSSASSIHFSFTHSFIQAFHAFLQVGPAHNSSSLSRLDGLEVYARPKTELVKEAAAAADSEAVEGGTGDLGRNLALAAVSLPGHLTAQKTGQTCSVYVLSQGLLTLTSLHQCLAGGAQTCALCDMLGDVNADAPWPASHVRHLSCTSAQPW